MFYHSCNDSVQELNMIIVTWLEGSVGSTSNQTHQIKWMNLKWTLHANTFFFIFWLAQPSRLRMPKMSTFTFWMWFSRPTQSFTSLTSSLTIILCLLLGKFDRLCFTTFCLFVSATTGWCLYHYICLNSNPCSSSPKLTECLHKKKEVIEQMEVKLDTGIDRLVQNFRKLFNGTSS